MGKGPNTPEGVVPFPWSIPKVIQPRVRPYNAKHISNNVTRAISGPSPRDCISTDSRALEKSSIPRPSNLGGRSNKRERRTKRKELAIILKAERKKGLPEPTDHLSNTPTWPYNVGARPSYATPRLGLISLTAAKPSLLLQRLVRDG